MKNEQEKNFFSNIKGKYNPELDKYKDDPSFQKVSKKKFEIAEKHINEMGGPAEFIKKLEEAKAKFQIKKNH